MRGCSPGGRRWRPLPGKTVPTDVYIERERERERDISRDTSTGEQSSEPPSLMQNSGEQALYHAQPHVTAFALYFYSKRLDVFH